MKLPTNPKPTKPVSSRGTPSSAGEGPAQITPQSSGSAANLDHASGDRLTSAGQSLASIGALPATEIKPLDALPAIHPPPSPDGLPRPQGILQGLWSLTTDFFTNSSATREVNRARRLVKEVGKHADAMAALSDADLAAQTDKFKATISEATSRQREAVDQAEAKMAAASPAERFELKTDLQAARRSLAKAQRKAMNSILPEAFATAREASRRATGMFPYDVQVMSGVLMHNGMVAEMYTGEGKTLAATMPAYLNALTGDGYHVVTVNDYLAHRDAEEMSRTYAFLGLTTGVLQNNSQQTMFGAEDSDGEVTRRQAYEADITYGTACEFAFDYLRDNQLRDLTKKVQRPLSGVLLDEIDSLLLDEARTPHIIAGKGEVTDAAMHFKFRDIVANLDWRTDVEWDLEEHWVHLTEEGYKKVEDALGVEDLYAETEDSAGSLYYLDSALKARFLLRNDEHYTVIDGEVRTVGHSGHAMMGRRFTRGLHQALEAKENLELQPENVTSASVTMRDYLSLYHNVGGMTGTAVSAKSVFQSVYNLDVARVPTRKELIRVDHPDRVFETAEQKLTAFLDDVEEMHKTGRPILIGSEWTSTAESLGAELQARGLPVRVLAAKSDTEEATIIANGGRLNAITVATTRGGRGVDIKLGGDAKVIAKNLQEQKGLSADEAQAEAAKIVAHEKAEVLDLGGLMVMSFEHLDSRRRDDQLRGRAGRQGAPGATVFYTSLEDPVYDGMSDVEDIRKGDKPFDESRARALTEKALTRSENRVNDVLVQSLPYDQTANMYSHRFYDMRTGLLEVSDARPLVHDVVEQVFDDIFDSFGKPGGKLESKEAAASLYAKLGRVLPLPNSDPPPRWLDMSLGEIRADIDKVVKALLDKRDASVGEEFSRLLERDIVLKSMDTMWSSFLDESQSLRQAIGFRGYAQKDPKLEFKLEMGTLWDLMVKEVRLLATEDLLKKMPRLPPAMTTPPPSDSDATPTDG